MPRKAEHSLPVQPSSRRAIEARLADYTDLTPVDRAEFFSMVGPCLTLAGSVGMSESDRREWLEAAFIAVGDLPINLLKRGATAALKTADHPSKIVPAIMAEVEGDLKRRRLAHAETAPRERQIEQKYCTPEEATKILEEFGLRSVFSA